MTRFDAVLFDAGGVLVLPDPTVLGPLLAPLGGDPSIDAHTRAHYRGMAEKSASASHETDWSVYDHVYVRAIGCDTGLVDLAAEILGAVRNAHVWRWPIPDTMVGLRALAERNVPMGVVSNASGQVERALAIAGVCQVGAGVGVEMRVVIDSHVVGVAKPDPTIFEFALHHFDGIDRSRIAYLGDSVVMDVGGARAAGLHPILVDPYDDHAGADFERVRSVSEFVARW